MSLKTLNSISTSDFTTIIGCVIIAFSLLMIVITFQLTTSGEELAEFTKHRIFMARLIFTPTIFITMLLMYVLNHCNVLYVHYIAKKNGYRSPFLFDLSKLDKIKFIYYHYRRDSCGKLYIGKNIGTYNHKILMFTSSDNVSENNQIPFIYSSIEMNEILYLKPIDKTWEQLEKEINIS